MQALEDVSLGGDVLLEVLRGGEAGDLLEREAVLGLELEELGLVLGCFFMVVVVVLFLREKVFRQFLFV